MKKLIWNKLWATAMLGSMLGIWAQAQEGGERKPIPEVPAEVEGADADEGTKGEDGQAESIEALIEKTIQDSTQVGEQVKEVMKEEEEEGIEDEVKKVEAEVEEDEVRKPEVVPSIEGTLFAPAKPGDLSELPNSELGDLPMDASLMPLGVEGASPKDDQLELMQVYEGLRQFDKAIESGEALLKRDPNNKEVLAGMSRAMVETGRSAEGLNYAERVLKLDPSPASQALKAAALLSDARVEEAEVILLKMKAEHKGAGAFPYESMIGFAELEMGKRKEAREIFEAIAYGTEVDLIEVDTAKKQLLLMDLDQAIEYRDVEKAKSAVAELKREYAGEPETSAAEAVELFLDGSAEEAAQRLKALRSEFPRLRQYPFLLQLADFSYVSGDFEAAESAYDEALSDKRTRPRERRSAVANRAQMRIREGEQLSVETGIIDGEEGSLATSTMKVRKAVGENWYLSGEIVREDINLESATGVLGEDERMDGMVGLERQLKNGLYVEGKLGASDGGGVGALEVGKRARFYPDAWKAGVAVNERAIDSAQLAALDGRQNRVSGGVTHQIDPRTIISAEAIFRQVEIDGTKLGSGAGANFEVVYRLNEEVKPANYFVAWSSAYAKFNRSSGWQPRGGDFADSLTEELGSAEIAANLVQPKFSRHGVEIRHEGQYGEKLFTRAVAGAYYRADSSDIEVSAGVGADWYLQEDLRLFIDALYTSSGRAGNSGSGVVQAQVGVAKSF